MWLFLTAGRQGDDLAANTQPRHTLGFAGPDKTFQADTTPARAVAPISTQTPGVRYGWGQAETPRRWSWRRCRHGAGYGRVPQVIGLTCACVSNHASATATDRGPPQ